MDESFVAGEEAMPACKKVTLQPTLTGMLAEYLHHSAIGGQVWPAAGSVDTEIRCFPKPEVCNAKA